MHTLEEMRGPETSQRRTWIAEARRAWWHEIAGYNQKKADRFHQVTLVDLVNSLKEPIAVYRLAMIPLPAIRSVVEDIGGHVEVAAILGDVRLAGNMEGWPLQR